MKKNLVLLLTLVIILCVTVVSKSNFAVNNINRTKSAVIGNTNANLLNDGQVVQKDNWIYYVNRCDMNQIYRMKIDGSCKTKLCDEHCKYINIVGDWIYYEGITNFVINHGNSIINYNNIYKMKLDGSRKTNLTNYSEEDICENDYMNVVGDWIYYLDYTKGNRLCRMKTDGSQKKVLCNDFALAMNVVGDWIYYSDANPVKGLYKMKIDGKGKKKLTNDDTAGINIVGDWVYYENMHDCKLYRIKTDGSKRSVVK